MPEPVLLPERIDATLVLRLNRPEAGNAINRELAEALLLALDGCDKDESVRAVVLTGSGERFFCTGGDVKAYARIESPKELESAFGVMRDVCDRLEQLPCATVAAINGYAIGGGCELALACDMRLMQASAEIGLPQSRLGITPGWDGGQRLVRAAGHSNAARLLFSGTRVAAAQAQAMRLVDEVTEDGAVLHRALQLASSFAGVAPLSVRAIRDLLHGCAEASADSSRQRDRAREVFARLWFTDDHKDAERAFAEKRPPRFSGR